VKLCPKCGKEMKRTLLMNTVSKECFQKYNCIYCGVEIRQKINANVKGSVNNEQAEKMDN
jgi:hypothetical protein